MLCAKVKARPRDNPAAGGSRVDPIAVILRRRPSIPDAGDESGLYAKEAGSMVARRRSEGGRRKRKTRNLTDKNGAAKQGQTADEEK